jgi:hypothetical protein
LKNAILLIAKDKVKYLEEAGFRPHGTREINGETLFQFITNDKILAMLNDKTKFSKNDYVLDARMTF